jgi:hypothetical protein
VPAEEHGMDEQRQQLPQLDPLAVAAGQRERLA